MRAQPSPDRLHAAPGRVQVVHRHDELLLAGAGAGDVEAGDVDPGVGQVPGEAAEGPGTVVEGDGEDLPDLQHVPAPVLQGGERHVGVVEDEVEVAPAVVGEGCRRGDVDLGGAQKLTEGRHHAGAVLGLDDDLSRHFRWYPCWRTESYRVRTAR